jgi:uncharacterized protein YacL
VIVASLGGLGIAGIVTIVSNIVDRFSTIEWNIKLWLLLLGIYTLMLLIGFLITYALAPVLNTQVRRFMNWLIERTSDQPLPELLLGLIGAIIGLIIAFFISTLVSSLGMGVTGSVLNTLIYFALGMSGYALIGRRWEEIPLPPSFKRLSDRSGGKHVSAIVPKVLDTSVLIDGRIFDLCRTGFLEGPLIASRFVLEELQHLSDSADSLKRTRGRRGLDILKRIQSETQIEVRIDDTDFSDATDVDTKLLKLTRQLGGSIVTTDYNLSKVANVSDIRVLNINELAKALKPVLLPGDEMTVQVVREGKEPNQGVAFMDDGTMIVIESGRRLIGQSALVTVTTVLQTSAGRMIFAKVKQ